MRDWKLAGTAVILGALLLASPAVAAEPAAASATASATADVGVPVFPYDITDRPYKVLGEVKAGVRKATVFSKAPDQGKVYRELWERAQKLGADAVVKATYGDPHMTAFGWGSVSATGVAVKFLAPGETAPAAAPAAQ